MRTPDQVIADLKKANKAVDEAITARDRFQQELLDIANFVNAEVNAIQATLPSGVHCRPGYTELA